MSETILPFVLFAWLVGAPMAALAIDYLRTPTPRFARD